MAENNYYLIKQTFPYIKTFINKIYIPCNITHLKKIISMMDGIIEVFLISEEDGKREDLTDIFGNRNFNVYEHRIESLKIIEMVYTHKYLKDTYFSFYSLKDIKHNDLEYVFMHDFIYKVKRVSQKFPRDILACNIAEHKKKKNYGNNYEDFISNKYLDLGYEVENTGIKKSFDDGGIDIIAKKENNIVLVQCKNWSMSNNYKINQKDLRAFVGDCFIYLKDKNLTEIKVSYHFIVSHEEILTKSAEIFLEKNNFIKFKCVPFEDNLNSNTK